MLVAISVLTLSGIQLIAAKVEQNKVRKAADQIQGWLLAAQAYFRAQSTAQTQTYTQYDTWPSTMQQMFPYIASSTVQNLSISTSDPWGDPYQPQPQNTSDPTKSAYQMPPAWAQAPFNMSPPSKTDIHFFTLQVLMKSRNRALAVAALLPNARLIKGDQNTLYLRAYIPPPILVKSATGHELVINLGTVNTKVNDPNNNPYNYTIDGYQIGDDNKRMLTIEHGYNPSAGQTSTNQKLTTAQIKDRGAVFIRKPGCPVGTAPYIQASVAGFGLIGGYSLNINTYDRYYSSSCKDCKVGNVHAHPSNLYSTAPAPARNGNQVTDPALDQNSVMPFFAINDPTSAPQYYYNPSGSQHNQDVASYQAIGSIIGVQVKLADQNYIDASGRTTSTTGWYLWLDITANAMMYPNYDTDKLPQIFKDCAMNINTQIYDPTDPNGTNDYPYLQSGSSNNTAYDYVPNNPYGHSSFQATGQYIYPATLIASTTIPLYRPSPCHFHSGQIAYLVSCIPTATLPAYQNQDLAQLNGIKDAMTDLES